MSRPQRIRTGNAGTRPLFHIRFVLLALLTSFSLLAVILLTSGCGSENTDAGSTSGTGPNGSIAHPTEATEIVIQITRGGGFVPVEYNLTLLPDFSLYGEGTVIVPGPVPAIFPEPALPNLQTTVISEEAVEAILLAAREVGLFNAGFDYGTPGITDVATTSIVINANGAVYRSDIYALGVESAAGGLTPEQEQARTGVNEFVSSLEDLSAYEPGELVWNPYEYSALEVYSRAAADSAPPAEVQSNRIQWPLGNLSTLGEPVQPQGFRRFLVSGEDLAALQPLMAQATVITQWESGESEYNLFFRPLLPEQTS